MATREEKAATSRGQAARKTAEAVPASEIVVGDKIFFPNSRKAQAVTSVATVTEEDGSQTVRINAIDVQWALKGDSEIRKEA